MVRNFNVFFFVIRFHYFALCEGPRFPCNCTLAGKALFLSAVVDQMNALQRIVATHKEHLVSSVSLIKAKLHDGDRGPSEFTISVPTCNTHLRWHVMYSPSHPEAPPDFLFDEDDTFVALKDVCSVFSSSC